MRKKIGRQELIYQVALGGVSAAIAMLLLWLSVVVRYGTIGFYVAACCAIMVPLTQRYYFSSIAAYVVSSLLAFAIVGDFFTISGYVVYFAPMAIATSVMLEKKVKLYISIPVKLVYINLALAFLYYVAGTIMISSDILSDVPYYAVALVGSVALIAIDFLLQYVYGRMKTVVSKALRKKLPVDSEVKTAEEKEDSNPFEDDEIFGRKGGNNIGEDNPFGNPNDGNVDDFNNKTDGKKDGDNVGSDSEDK